VALHDINSIKKIAELESKIREQKRVDKLKDELISVVSHELRTPLTVIKGTINNLLDGITGLLNDKQRTVLSTTKRNADRLSRLIDNLLDLSRLESGHVKMNRKQMTAHSLVQDVVQNLHPQAEQSKIIIATNTPQTMTQINADHDMICQVLTNLVMNALQYAKTKITISTKHLPKNIGTEFVQFTVSDDGIGIDPKYHDRLFNKFEQINRPQGGSGYKGTGLGLAICKEIISLHHGKIWVESEAGKGTNFCFTIPVYQEQDEILDELKRHIEQSKKYQKPLAFMAMAITNLNTISKHCTEKDIEWMINDISKEIHGKALRKSDVIKYQKGSKEFFIILNDTNHTEAKTISKRIHNITKDCFCPGNTGKIFADLNIGIAMYPDDEKDADKLMAISLKEIR
jgi:light-regulated signal transduction histidine kinase (bacteriophytochrome)